MSCGTNECIDVQFSYRKLHVTGSALSWRIVLSRCDVITITLWQSFTVEVVLKVISVGTPAIRHIHVKKSPYEHVSDYEWLPRYSCLNLQKQRNGEW